MSNQLKRIARKMETAPEASKPTYDAHSGIFTDMALDSKGIMHVNRVQDVEPIIKRNKARFNGVSTKGRKFGGDMRQVASVPLVVIEKWMKEGKIKNPFRMDEADKKAMKRLLNDPDNRFLRTCPGQL